MSGALGLLFVLSAGAAGPVSLEPRGTAGLERVCGLLTGCSLPEPAGLCPPALARKTVPFASARCQDARELAGRGISADTDLGFRVYSFLGHRHQVVYSVEGEVPISRARLDFLVRDLPLAAKLLTRFQRIPYLAEYLDATRTRFRASRGGDLSGEAELVSGSTEEGRLFYFGLGTSQFGFWKLKGRGLVHVTYAPIGPDGRRVTYRIRVVASPANAVINALMKLGVFKSLVERRIRQVVTDITEATLKLEMQGLAGVANRTGWTAEEKERIAAFLKLP